MNQAQLTISAVMPAYNAEPLLERVLPPLLAMRDAGELVEVLVVDDQSSDATAQKARDMGATVLVTPQNGGPGLARNLAAEHAIGDILWFVDSDVIAHPGGAARILEAFANPGVEACFGSYDATPGAPSWFSNYKNLMHRFHHQNAQLDAGTFWSGCGAVRAQTFRALGGFDTEIYRVPSIEDIELGYRIRRAGGRIMVCPDLLGKHLKVWSVRQAIFTDIFRRALPWSRLMISREGLIDDLNTGKAERARAVIAGLFVLSILALPSAQVGWPVPFVMFAIAIAANWRFFSYLRENGGIRFALASLLFHQLYYLYSAAAYVWCLIEYHLLGRKNRLHVP